VDNFGYDSNTIATLSVFDDDTASTVAHRTSPATSSPAFVPELHLELHPQRRAITTQYRVYYDSFAHGPRLTARGIYSSILSTNPNPHA